MQALLQFFSRRRTIDAIMDGIGRSLRQNWDFALALLLVYAAIGINLGPGFFFLTGFLHGCGYIIHTALKR